MEVSNCILFLCLISFGSSAIPSLSSNYLNSEFEEGKTKCEYYNATCFMDPGNPGNTNCQGMEFYYIICDKISYSILCASYYHVYILLTIFTCSVSRPDKRIKDRSIYQIYFYKL